MSALVLSILLFVIISVLMGAVGFKFWVQPKAALERVAGDVALGQHEVRHPSLSFRDLLQKVGNAVPQNPTCGYQAKPVFILPFKIPNPYF